jgi:HlyD family secretion protein
VDIATKVAGRVVEVVPHEGDMIETGSVVARLDPAEINAELRQAQAQAQLSRFAVASAGAVTATRASELTFAEQQLRRTAALARDGYAPKETLDQRRQLLASAQSALRAAAAEAEQAEASVQAADAHVDQLRTLVGDTTILSPAQGRVQYRLIEPGAVLAAGGQIVTLLDLSDVYITIFLPAAEAGRLALGDAARVVLDAFPQYVFPATISFVATEAQFTPKAVETSSEREKLMFRIKLQAPRDMLTGMQDRVKTGLRGIGYVRVAGDAAWPDRLAVKLPR